MSSTKNNRRKAGMWLFGILGLIFTALGIRYVSSNGWWGSIFNPGSRQALQTVNTGMSVQVASTQMTSVPASVLNTTRPGGSTTPLLPDDNDGTASNGSTTSSQGRKMW